MTAWRVFPSTQAVRAVPTNPSKPHANRFWPWSPFRTSRTRHRTPLVQARVHSQDRWYDPAVLTALDAQLLDEAAEYSMRAMTIRLADLRIGMEILEDIITTDDLLVVVGAGTQITGSMLERLHNFARIKGIREPIVIKRPDAFLNGFSAA